MNRERCVRQGPGRDQVVCSNWVIRGDFNNVAIYLVGRVEGNMNR